ncbi:MAG: HD domain-containing protein [Betaproteobacteria bacterium]|nr:MAG: HD domain-containing protein [Betaproteobacteria bacterium]
MNRTELTELLVSYRDEMGYARLSKLIGHVDAHLCALLAQEDQEIFDALNDVARAIVVVDWRGPWVGRSQGTRQPLDALVVPACRILLEVALAHIPRATPEKGVRFAERAIDIASAYGDKSHTRRGFNVCSWLYNLTGSAADGVEYGLMAAARAKELDFNVGVVGALTNVNLSLILFGLHEEAIEIAERAYRAYSHDPDCKRHIGLIVGNAGHAALALKRYREAADYAKRAIDLHGDVTDTMGANDRIIDHFTWLKCAIALNEPATANDRMTAIEWIAREYPSPIAELHREFAEALYVGYAKKALMATAFKLGHLRSKTANYATFYVDLLAHLMRLASDTEDHGSALLFAGELVDAIASTRLSKVRERLIELGQTPKTVTPAKDSTQEIIDRIVSQALETQQTQRTRVATLGNRELTRSLEELAATAELCDDPSRRAIYRVGKLSKLLALELGYTEAEATALEHAARLHDIGKLGIPSAILAKPNMRLNESEYLVMWRHAAMGAQILGQCHEPIFALAAEIAHAHHEAWDGTGYPRNLQGEEIHEAARIVCLAENYDSMTHNRSYRHALTHPEAVEFISRNAGIQFDPEMTPVFIRVVERLLLFHGNRLDDWLAEDALANESRHRRQDGEHDTMLSRLADLVPDSVFAKLRGTLLDAQK